MVELKIKGEIKYFHLIRESDRISLVATNKDGVRMIQGHILAITENGDITTFSNLTSRAGITIEGYYPRVKKD